MDPYTEQLLERTRQRREMLNQKLGKVPEAAPRKRILEDASENMLEDDNDDSPKRRCSRDTEKQIKEDTPAISSVRSRLNHLRDQRANWSDTEEKNDTTVPTPVPRFSLTEKENEEVCVAKPGRGRFAKLAQDINSWEDDLTHVNLQKPEEPKPRWQPPRPTPADDQSMAESVPSAPCIPSLKTKHAPCPPTVSSPQKKRAPEPPILVCPSYGSDSPQTSRFVSPKKSERTITLMNSPASRSNVHHEIKKAVDQLPVNARGLDESSSSEEPAEEPTQKPVLERMASWKKVTDTPKSAKPVDPALQSMSAKLASWEQKVTQTPKSERSVATGSTVNMPMKQLCTPVRRPEPQQSQESVTTEAYGTVEVSIPKGDPASQPVSSRMATWQQKSAKLEAPKEEEPTAYSVLARMSAWEHMSSAQQVAHIKKVDPGTPVCTPKKSPGKALVPKSGMKTQKSFTDSISERANQMSTGPSPLKKTPNNPQSAVKVTASKPPVRLSPDRSSVQATPGRTPAPPPIGSATKLMQQKLIEQTQHTKTDDMAERLRRERMAELQTIQSRWQNGILKDDNSKQQPDIEPKPLAEILVPTQETNLKNRDLSRRDTIKAEAKADHQVSSSCDKDLDGGGLETEEPHFERKLEALGFELSGGDASYDFKAGQQRQVGTPPAPRLPSNINNGNHSQAEQPATERVEQKMDNVNTPNRQNYSKGPHTKTDNTKMHSGCKSSIYRLISKKEETNRPHVKRTAYPEREPSCSSNPESLDEEDEDTEPMQMPTGNAPPQDSDDSFEYLGEQLPVERSVGHPPISRVPEDIDVSLSAFVPESVRRESILPNPPSQDLSFSSDEDMGPTHAMKSPGYAGKSTSNLVRLGQGASMTSQDSLASLTSEVSTTSSQSSLNQQLDDRQRPGMDNTDTEDDSSNEAIDDFLDEAMDEDLDQERGTDRGQVPVPRKRRSHMMATDPGRQGRDRSLAYSVSAYRSQRNLKAPVPKARIIRKTHPHEEDLIEEEMPVVQQMPPELERKSVNDRIQELLELVSQEQSVIMQTSNALNQCCSGDSLFAGSSEQVECNRLLLVSCQRRQAYLTEIQKLKETRQLEPVGRGPRGSITISDIRLPLKKEFVTKIGSPTDNIVHYFVILIRNGAQVILTQMLSTHDPMMRGSLDFPNLIKIHGISGDFRIVLEIYSMSVSREIGPKDKKKKTPAKKHKAKNLFFPVESPGGPNAVHTTSFTLITTLALTLKCLDKSSFTLERIPYLSPLHGTIYLRLKCLMEQNVEERGFLTMFEDVSGLGAWHRRWCVLTGNKLCYWKYPDDESRKEPIGFIDLKRCITESAGLIPRDICARPNTFELVTVRQPRKGEQDTLITKTYNTMTTMKFMLSADTKEERIMWCNKINRALVNIRTWHSDAMRPIKLPHKNT